MRGRVQGHHEQVLRRAVQLSAGGEREEKKLARKSTVDAKFQTATRKKNRNIFFSKLNVNAPVCGKSIYVFGIGDRDTESFFSAGMYSSIMIFIPFELFFMHKKDCTPPFIVEVNFDSVSDLGAGLVNANPSKGEEEKLQTKISGFLKTCFFPQDFAWNTARYMLLVYCYFSVLFFSREFSQYKRKEFYKLTLIYAYIVL